MVAKPPAYQLPVAHKLPPTAPGPLTAAYGPLTAAHGPLNAGHGPLTAAHGPLTAAHGPLTAAHGPLNAAHGPLNAAHEQFGRQLFFVYDKSAEAVPQVLCFYLSWYDINMETLIFLFPASF